MARLDRRGRADVELRGRLARFRRELAAAYPELVGAVGCRWLDEVAAIEAGEPVTAPGWEVGSPAGYVTVAADGTVEPA